MQEHAGTVASTFSLSGPSWALHSQAQPKESIMIQVSTGQWEG